MYSYNLLVWNWKYLCCLHRLNKKIFIRVLLSLILKDNYKQDAFELCTNQSFKAGNKKRERNELITTARRHGGVHLFGAKLSILWALCRLPCLFLLCSTNWCIDPVDELRGCSSRLRPRSWRCRAISAGPSAGAESACSPARSPRCRHQTHSCRHESSCPDDTSKPSCDPMQECWFLQVGSRHYSLIYTKKPQ